MPPYLFNVLLGLDLFLSTLTGGIPGETLSGRAGASLAHGSRGGKFWVAVINFVMRNPRHCQDAVQNDILRAHFVIKDDDR